jgi:MFS transporter, PHS family, inorganic phosphate transporter
VAFWPGPPEQVLFGIGGNEGNMPPAVIQALKTSTSAGLMLGMLGFGWFADVYGRRTMYGIELAIVAVATISCALVSPSQSMSAAGLLIFWRVIMVRNLFFSLFLNTRIRWPKAINTKPF